MSEVTSNFYNFVQFDLETKKPIYCLFNFNYEQYAIDYNLPYTEKYDIFTDFWERAGFLYTEPIVVSDEYLKYFSEITQQMIDYLNKYGFFHQGYLANIIPETYVRYYFLARAQFDMVEYTDNEARRLQDYYYEDTEFYYCKYSFDFEKFSNDFKVWGSRLLVICDFIIRNLALSGVVYYSSSYGLYSEFRKYFILENQISLREYMVPYSVNSVLDNTYKCLNHIDFVKYPIVNNLPITDPVEAHEEYLREGQFLQRIVPFIDQENKPIEIAKEACTVVISDCCYGSGFLYSNRKDNKVYLISAYHLLEDEEDQFYIYASLQKTNVNEYYSSTSTTAQFRIVGIDRISDILVALYEPDLPFNISNKVDISGYKTFEINTDYNLQNGDEVLMVGNLGVNDIQSIYAGKVMNFNYAGPEDEPSRVPSVLIQSYLTTGSSGSPVLYDDKSGSPLKVIGIIQDKLTSSPQTCISMKSNYLNYIVSTMIRNYYLYLARFGNNIVELNNAIKNGVPIAFFGFVPKSYYYRLYPNDGTIELYKKYPQLKNLNYTGGTLITDFLLGFDFIQKCFITTAKDLNKHNIFKIQGPFLNTRFYRRYLRNLSPLLIVSMSNYDCIEDNYEKTYVGKYSTQLPQSVNPYGFQPIAAFPNDPKYYNKILYQYPIIKVSYYWYDGISWQFDEENIGGNTPEWYVESTDLNGNLYYQHKFEFPYVLYDFVKYIYSHIGLFGGNTVNLGTPSYGNNAPTPNGIGNIGM